jgi:hypothetical protein
LQRSPSPATASPSPALASRLQQQQSDRSRPSPKQPPPVPQLSPETIDRLDLAIVDAFVEHAEWCQRQRARLPEERGAQQELRQCDAEMPLEVRCRRCGCQLSDLTWSCLLQSKLSTCVVGC